MPRAAVVARPTFPTLPTFRPNSAPSSVAPTEELLEAEIALLVSQLA
jgi:hypothetical protein